MPGRLRVIFRYRFASPGEDWPDPFSVRTSGCGCLTGKKEEVDRFYAGRITKGAEAAEEVPGMIAQMV